MTTKWITSKVDAAGKPRFRIFVNDGKGSEALSGSYDISRFGELMLMMKYAFEVNTEGRVQLTILKIKE